MHAVRKRATISDDHMLRVEMDIPQDVPVGEAEILVLIDPVPALDRQSDLVALAGSLRESPRFSGNPVDIQRTLRNEWD